MQKYFTYGLQSPTGDATLYAEEGNIKSDLALQ